MQPALPSWFLALLQWDSFEFPVELQSASAVYTYAHSKAGLTGTYLENWYRTALEGLISWITRFFESCLYYE